MEARAGRWVEISSQDSHPCSPSQGCKRDKAASFYHHHNPGLKQYAPASLGLTLLSQEHDLGKQFAMESNLTFPSSQGTARKGEICSVQNIYKLVASRLLHFCLLSSLLMTKGRAPLLSHCVQFPERWEREGRLGTFRSRPCAS